MIASVYTLDQISYNRSLFLGLFDLCIYHGFIFFILIYYKISISVWSKLGRVPDENWWCVQEDDSEGAAAKLLWPGRSVHDQSDWATMTTSVYGRD